jgi:hypothetical protein
MQPILGDVEPRDPPEAEQELDRIHGRIARNLPDDRSQRFLQIRG